MPRYQLTFGSYVSLWPFPPHIANVEIEGWGAGGNGDAMHGGQGGGYFRAALSATMLTGRLTFRFDNGEAQAFWQDSATDPVNVTVTLTAAAGVTGSSGSGGGYSTTSNSSNPVTHPVPSYSLAGKQGQYGSAGRILSLAPHAANVLIASVLGGDGGESGGGANTRGFGGAGTFVLMTKGAVIDYVPTAPANPQATLPTPGVEPGGGGGGSADLLGRMAGAQGGRALIRLSWDA
jgi:hypothetical protein